MSSDIVDREQLHLLQDILGEEFVSVIGSFINQLEDLIGYIDKNACVNHLSDMHHKIHTVKGAALNLYANHFAQACAQLEESLQKESVSLEQTSLVQKNLQTVKEQAVVLKEFLKDYRKGL